jgi:hypothetical protein
LEQFFHQLHMDAFYHPKSLKSSMKPGNLVTFFKNMKLWMLPIISRLTMSRVNIFHSEMKLKINKKSKDSISNPIIFYIWHYKWLLSDYVIATFCFHLGPFAQISIRD